MSNSRRPRNVAAAAVAQLPVQPMFACAPCIMREKARLFRGDSAEAGEIRAAVTLINGTALCGDCIQVQAAEPGTAARRAGLIGV